MADLNKRIWIYFPFKDIDNDSSMPGNAKRYKEKYTNFQGALKRDDSLGDVQNDDMLIVAAHGLPTMSTTIGVSVLNPNVSNNEKLARALTSRPPATMFDKIEANDLAELMKTNGLKKGHKRIKFITCGGAGMGVIDEASVTYAANVASDKKTFRDITSANFASVKHAADCFASVFARAMRERDYLQLLVGAYPGFVNANELKKILTIETSSGGGRDYPPAEKWNASLNWGLGGFEPVEIWAAKVGSIPTKAVGAFWFNGAGERV